MILIVASTEQLHFHFNSALIADGRRNSRNDNLIETKIIHFSSLHMKNNIRIL